MLLGTACAPLTQAGYRWAVVALMALAGFSLPTTAFAQVGGGEEQEHQQNPCKIYGCDSSGWPYDENYPWGADGNEEHPNGFDGKPGDSENPDGGTGAMRHLAPTAKAAVVEVVRHPTEREETVAMATEPVLEERVGTGMEAGAVVTEELVARAGERAGTVEMVGAPEREELAGQAGPMARASAAQVATVERVMVEPMEGKAGPGAVAVLVEDRVE